MLAGGVAADLDFDRGFGYRSYELMNGHHSPAIVYLRHSAGGYAVCIL
jgi:hypothetical protein